MHPLVITIIKTSKDYFLKSCASTIIIIGSTVVASYGIAIVAPEETVADAAVADEKYGGEENETADGAGLALQEESDQIEDHEHDVSLEESRIHGLWYQEYGY